MTTKATIYTGLLKVAISCSAMAIPFSAMSADNVRLMLDFLPTGDYAPYYAAIDNGTYANNNISLKITRGTGSGDTILKVAGGAADIGKLGSAQVCTPVPNTQLVCRLPLENKNKT